MRQFLILLLLALIVSPAKAETTAAVLTAGAGTGATNMWQRNGVYNRSLDGLGQVMCTSGAFGGSMAYLGIKSVNSGAGIAILKCDGFDFTAYKVGGCESGTYNAATGGCDAYLCPPNQGWTLSGSTCSRPDCPANTTRDETTGACTSVCETRAQQAPTYGWYTSAVGGPSVEGSYCDSGCSVALNPAPTGTSYNNGVTKIQRYEKVNLPFACTNGAAIPGTSVDPGQVPPEPPKRPPCAATEGVLTSTSGRIACVPSGTPSAQTPQVRKEFKIDRFPDGSTKTTETTYTKDPLSQVQDVNQKITTTGPTSNPTGTGQAGTPGVTNSSGSSSAGPPDNPAPSTGVCKDNPDLQICKGGMNEEATQKKVLAELEKMGNPGNTPYDAVTNAKETDTAKQANDTENTKFSDAAKGVFDPVSAQKGSWETAMSSGWFSPIPTSGCTPFSGTVGGRSFTIDHCPTASKISVILEYAMWFMVVVGVFVMFTGGRAQGA